MRAKQKSKLPLWKPEWAMATSIHEVESSPFSDLNCTWRLSWIIIYLVPLSTTPHCAATAKARLSSPLFCASIGKGVKARAVVQRWLTLSVSRPSDNSVQWTSESKMLQRICQCRTSFIKEMCSPATWDQCINKNQCFFHQKNGNLLSFP